MTNSWGWEERRMGKISSIRHGEHGGQPHLRIFFLGYSRFFVFCIFLFLQGIIIKGNPPFFTLFSRDWILAQEKGNGKWLWAISFVSWKADIPAGAVSASLIGIGVMQPCLASQVDYRPLPLRWLAYFNCVRKSPSLAFASLFGGQRICQVSKVYP